MKSFSKEHIARSARHSLRHKDRNLDSDEHREVMRVIHLIEQELYGEALDAYNELDESKQVIFPRRTDRKLKIIKSVLRDHQLESPEDSQKYLVFNDNGCCIARFQHADHAKDFAADKPMAVVSRGGRDKKIQDKIEDIIDSIPSELSDVRDRLRSIVDLFQ